MTNKERIKEILEDNIGPDIDRVVTGDELLTRDLGVDSLNLLEFIMSVEDEFDVEIPDSELSEDVHPLTFNRLCTVIKSSGVDLDASW
jgi:acyl carrier protein